MRNVCTKYGAALEGFYLSFSSIRKAASRIWQLSAPGYVLEWARRSLEDLLDNIWGGFGESSVAILEHTQSDMQNNAAFSASMQQGILEECSGYGVWGRLGGLLRVC